MKMKLDFSNSKVRKSLLNVIDVYISFNLDLISILQKRIKLLKKKCFKIDQSRVILSSDKHHFKSSPFRQIYKQIFLMFMIKRQIRSWEIVNNYLITLYPNDHQTLKKLSIKNVEKMKKMMVKLYAKHSNQ